MRAAVLVAVALSIVCLSWAGDAPAMQRKPVNIPAQDLQLALQALGQQRGLHIIFTSEDVADLEAHGVTGNLTSDEALQQLLGGTGLTYQHLDPQTVSILPSEAETQATGQSTSATGAQAATKALPGNSAGGAIHMAQVTVTADTEGDGTEDDAQRQEAQIRRFIQSHANTGLRDGAISRWHMGICPQTTGLSASSNELVSNHVKEVAARVGAPSGLRWLCPKPNIKIVFTSEAATVWAAAVKAASPPNSQGESPARQPPEFAHPIQAFYVTADRGYRFSRPRRVPLRTGQIAGGPIGTPIRNFFIRVVIVVDTNRVPGYDTAAVADYITMLALSTEISLDKCAELPSILDLLSSDCEAREKPQGLTVGDTAYLKALYSVKRPWSLSEEESTITQRMKRDIGRAESDSGAKSQ